ncbi:MAG: gas vesicle protein K [Candidatus Thermochlorobacter sp.]
MIKEPSAQELSASLQDILRTSHFPKQLDLTPETVEQGLGQLVLTIVDVLRMVMEKQAIRRIESETLTEQEIEQLGLTLMKLDEKIEELCTVFGIKREDLNINLGELGNLL